MIPPSTARHEGGVFRAENNAPQRTNKHRHHGSHYSMARNATRADDKSNECFEFSVWIDFKLRRVEYYRIDPKYL